MPRKPIEDRLGAYRSKRHPARTPEPVPPEPGPSSPPHPDSGPAESGGNTFVVQEHHARALHWDFRLERDGALVSWAVPKGVPLDPGTRRLAVQTEDHPLEYAAFEGAIPPREYGGGAVTVWDRGHYDTEKWKDDEVKVVLHGERVRGRYVLIRTGAKNWIMQRLDDADARRQPPPELVRPMLAVPGTLPAENSGWAFEFKWDGIRTVAYVTGGRIRLMSRNDRDVTVSYPELRHAGEVLGSRDAVLDGEIVAFDDAGRPSFGHLQRRMHVAGATKARRLAEEVPVVYLVFDLMYFDGRSTVGLPYRARRELLDTIGLTADGVVVPPWFEGGGADVLAASRHQGFEGVVAKRLESTYQPGRRSRDWVKVKLHRTQEVVIVGWTPGRGRRHNSIGALLLAVHHNEAGLVYAGRVGTGLTDAMLEDLAARLEALGRADAPLKGPVPRAQVVDAHWVEPRLVGEVSFSEWTADRRLRHPSWRGLRPDMEADAVAPEE
jgi:bifunctional non-homologous end joining protein LigD